MLLEEQILELQKEIKALKEKNEYNIFPSIDYGLISAAVRRG